MHVIGYGYCYYCHSNSGNLSCHYDRIQEQVIIGGNDMKYIILLLVIISFSLSYAHAELNITAKIVDRIEYGILASSYVIYF